MKEKFYITTAIFYASQKPHIGNTYEVVMADAIARYKRMRGYDVYFLTGTDEHGLKIQEAAEKADVEPQRFVDGVTGELKQIWDKFGISYDGFIRTTDEQHCKAVQKIFKKLYEQGDIYKGTYEGWYCTPDESFWTPAQLVDGKCPECGREVIKANEDAYFLKLTKYQERLAAYIDEHPDFIKPDSRKNEMVNNFLKPGLQDLCVSRSSFKWGIPVDFDDGHVIYVWIDALSNYITALGYTPDGDSEMFKKYWPADLHVIGKDIIRFHTIYWPVMLMGLGIELPRQVIGHPWLLSGTDKMSKSRGNVMYGDDLIDLFGRDTIRYYLLSEMGYNDDGSITFENIIKTANTDLANVTGNLINRTAAMIKQYFDGVIPPAAETEACDAELHTAIESLTQRAFSLLDEYKLSDASAVIIEIFKACNKYIDVTTPWVLARDTALRPRLGTVLRTLVDGILRGTQLIAPYMPDAANAVFPIFGLTAPAEFTEHFDADGKTIGDVPILFARIDEKKKLSQINDFYSAKNPSVKETVKAADASDNGSSESRADDAQISIDDFSKVKLVAAQVVECEKVAKSDKLLRLIVDIGSEKRQVVSGIAKFYAPEELVGKKLVLVSNLKPAMLRGVESRGMILCSGEDNVRVVELSPDVPNGTVIR